MKPKLISAISTQLALIIERDLITLKLLCNSYYSSANKSC